MADTDDGDIDWENAISAMEAVAMIEPRFGALAAKSEIADRMRDGLLEVFARKAWDSTELDIAAAWRKLPDEDDPDDAVEFDIAVRPFVWRQSKQWLVDVSNWRWPSGRFSTVQRRSPALRYMFEDVHFLRSEIEELRDAVAIPADRLRRLSRDEEGVPNSGKSEKSKVGPRLRDKAWAAVILEVVELHNAGKLTTDDFPLRADLTKHLAQATKRAPVAFSPSTIETVVTEIYPALIGDNGRGKRSPD